MLSNKCINIKAINIKSAWQLFFGADVWDTALQVGRSRVRFRWCHWNILLQYFRLHCDPGVGLTSDRNEYQQYFLWVRADKLTTSMFRMSWNLGAATCWKPQGQSRPVMGLLYLLLITYSAIEGFDNDTDVTSVPIKRYVSGQ